MHELKLKMPSNSAGSPSGGAGAVVAPGPARGRKGGGSPLMSSDGWTRVFDGQHFANGK